MSALVVMSGLSSQFYVMTANLITYSLRDVVIKLCFQKIIIIIKKKIVY